MQLTDAAYRRIDSLHREEQRVYRPVSASFGFIDLVSSSTACYSAQSANKNAIPVYIKGGDAQRFLSRLERVEREMFSHDGINKRTGQDEYLLV